MVLVLSEKRTGSDELVDSAASALWENLDGTSNEEAIRVLAASVPLARKSRRGIMLLTLGRGGADLSNAKLRGGRIAVAES